MKMNNLGLERFQLSVVLMLQNEKNNKISSLFLMISFDKSKWIFYITFEDTALTLLWYLLLLKITCIGNLT